jgi:hypothetical protein
VLTIQGILVVPSSTLANRSPRPVNLVLLNAAKDTRDAPREDRAHDSREYERDSKHNSRDRALLNDEGPIEAQAGQQQVDPVDKGQAATEAGHHSVQPSGLKLHAGTPALSRLRSWLTTRRLRWLV